MIHVRSLAVAMVSTVALLTGCAGSQPPAPGQGLASSDRSALLRTPVSPQQLLQLQAEGRLQGPVPAWRLHEQLQRVRQARPAIASQKTGTIAVWAGIRPETV
jgi:hypothetical protein